MKEWPYNLLGPWAFREVFHPSSGPGGYLYSTSPRSSGWFWDNQPKDPRSSLRSLFMTRNAFQAVWREWFLTISFCFAHSKSGVLPHTHALEISISYYRTLNFIGCTGGAPNGCSPRASSGFWIIIHSKVFIRNHFYFPLALWLEVSLVFNLALCLRSRHYLGLKRWFMGCTEGAPNGCSPRALSGFLKIILSKVFVSCPFAEGYLFFFRMP
jgi:hypothetical protein